MGDPVKWNIHHRVVDDVEPVDSGYGNSTETARKHDIVCDGNVLPKTIKDRDTLQLGGGQGEVCDGLTLNIIAVDDDVFVGDAELVVPVPTLDCVIVNAF